MARFKFPKKRSGYSNRSKKYRVTVYKYQGSLAAVCYVYVWAKDKRNAANMVRNLRLGDSIGKVSHTPKSKRRTGRLYRTKKMLYL